MKLTKRMKNAIIQSIIANTIFLLILLAALLFFSVPKFLDISLMKSDLKVAVDDYNDITQNGVSFHELRRVANSSELTNDLYTASLLRNIDATFYEQAFNNETGEDFDTFIEAKQEEIREIKSSDEYIEKDKALGEILPLYTQEAEFSEVGLSDFHFTNYIENLIYSFDLSAKGDIGIGEIALAEEKPEQVEVSEEGEEGTTISRGNDLQEDIYKIPLTFEIAGQKADVIDFIHFFENVGSISVDEENLNIHNDNFISKVLESDDYSKDYNIYKNQIAEIVSLEMDSYPDSSPVTFSNDKDLITLLKSDQARDKIEVKLILNFYVTGVPTYRMDEFVNNFFAEYSTLAAKVSSNAQKYTVQAYKYSNGDQIQAITQLKNIDALIVSQSTNIQDLRKRHVLRDDIQDIYNTAIEYSAVLDWIEADYNKQIEILTQ